MTKTKIVHKKIIAQAKLNHWNRVDLGNVYKEIKKIKQQYRPPDFDLRVGDRVFKTEVLADASSTYHLPAGMQEYRDSHETLNPLQDPAPADLAVNCPLTHAELETALSSITKLKVSEGSDLILYQMLKEQLSNL